MSPPNQSANTFPSILSELRYKGAASCFSVVIIKLIENQNTCNPAVRDAFKSPCVL